MELMLIDENGDVICWLDTKNDTQVVKKGYALLIGEKLTVTEMNGTIKPIYKVDLKK